MDSAICAEEKLLSLPGARAAVPSPAAHTRETIAAPPMEVPRCVRFRYDLDQFGQRPERQCDSECKIAPSHSGVVSAAGAASIDAMRRHVSSARGIDQQGSSWCPLPDSNRHLPCGSTDFKSVASTNSAKRAGARTLPRGAAEEPENPGESAGLKYRRQMPRILFKQRKRRFLLWQTRHTTRPRDFKYRWVAIS